ncbi:glutaminyl-peptide cyclotransferase [Acanthopleuribacter pedis]|uniref:Glutaminyl-peptide cyclotransferase n=1 Tax=Acanthopleuribacter pedis TaxID=442870 RepID=A0A8J7Q2Y2_9BACT|nr:glutaminyl-peptide cyclotransferase [Acanthopleuribacter pedis]MBO1317544.1 glutaminyl-peptide cyclotransferase [Acanthopleuribacter pedis]
MAKKKKNKESKPENEAASSPAKWLVPLLVAVAAGVFVTLLLGPKETVIAAGSGNWSYKVVQKFRHDPGAYTQGLLVHNGVLYESTGLRGQSSLRRVDLMSGIVQQHLDLDKRYFGEGLHFHRGVLIQLTWQAGEALVYNNETFAHLRTLRYEGQGWGLTGDGNQMVMSDGSDVLRFRNSSDFSVVREVKVTENGKKVDNLNELEWIEGRIWANVYGTNDIVMIEPEDGRVVGRLKLNGLLQREDRNGREDVLNGIAYDRATKAIYVTGKRYSYLYQIEVTEPKPRG